MQPAAQPFALASERSEQLLESIGSNMRTRTAAVVTCLTAATVALDYGFVRYGRFPVSSTVRKLHARTLLSQAIGPVRPIEGRLIGLGYSEYQKSGRIDLSRVDRDAARRIQRVLKASRSTETAGALAIIEVLASRLDKAAPILERALATDPRDAKLLSDLAAIKLAQGTEARSGKHLLASLEATRRARRSDPQLPEAAFNEALTLEKLSLRLQARQAWSILLGNRSQESWRNEARRHFAALDTQTASETWSEGRRLLQGAAKQRDANAVRRVVQRFPQLTREYAERVALADWATAVPGRGEQGLWLAGSIATAHLAISGDRFLQDAVDAISAAEAARLEEPLERLKQAHRSYRVGLDWYEEPNAANARVAFEAARKSFASAASPFVYWATFYLALCAYESQDFDTARLILARLAVELLRQRYPSLSARVLWVTGLLHYEAGEPDRSLASYWRALAVFRRTKEPENLAAVHNLIAGSLDLLGQHDRAWKHRLEALRFLPQVVSPRRCLSILGQTALAANAQGFPEAALAFQNEAVARAERDGQPRLCAIALLQRAEINGRLGRQSRASRDLQRASQWTARIPGPGERRGIQADLAAADAASRAPAGALASLAAAIREYEDTNYAYRLPALYQRRAKVWLAVGRHAEAERDLVTAIRLTDEQESAVQTVRKRLTFLESRQSLYDDLIRSLALSGKTELALKASERARLVLFESVSETNRRSVELNAQPFIASYRRDLPPAVHFVEYALAGDRLVCWVVSRRDFFMVSRRVDPEHLHLLIDSFVSALRSGGTTRRVNTLSARLGKLLWEPIESRVGSGSQVVILPDKALWHLPFAALKTSEGQFLLEEHIVSYAPGIALSAANTPLTVLGTRRLSVAVVADPSFDRQMFPELPALDGAREEASVAASVYSSPLLLYGVNATTPAFLNALGRRDVVILSGHAILNRADPLLSHLALAPSSQDGGVLYAHELLEVRGRLPQLIVLSACESALGPRTERAGAGGLTWSFLAAGVPAVVASYWKVEDHRAGVLLQPFHAAVAEGRNAADALHAAQLEVFDAWKRDSTLPADWALFGLFTGSSLEADAGI